MKILNMIGIDHVLKDDEQLTTNVQDIPGEVSLL